MCIPSHMPDSHREGMRKITLRTRTCFTSGTIVPSRTLARETINLVSAVSTMLTRVVFTLIDVCSEKQCYND